jgi:hypothetical protein
MAHDGFFCIAVLRRSRYGTSSEAFVCLQLSVISNGVVSLSLRILNSLTSTSTSGRHIRIDLIASAEHELAFTASTNSERIVQARAKSACSGISVKHDLHQARAITKLYKHERAKIAAHVCPAHEDNLFAAFALVKFAQCCSFPTAQYSLMLFAPQINNFECYPRPAR